MQSNCDPFWVNDPFLLFRIDRIIEFYPTIDMCSNERINAISRFALYAGLCVSFVKKDMKPLAFSLAIAATLAFLYYPKSDKDMLEVYYEQKRMNCMHSTDNNPFMNLLPLDTQFASKQNTQPCPNQQLPQNNSTIQSHTVPSHTRGATSNQNYANFLFPKEMGSCKNGNIESCKI